METIASYFLNIAPAIAISITALLYLWRAYQDLVKYQREQDKHNIETLTELSNVLGTFRNQNHLDNKELRTAISNNTNEVKSHIDNRVQELKNARH